MNDKNDPFKDFITHNTSEELKKPINEYSEILKQIEPKKTFFNLHKWAISGFVTACLILSVSVFLKNNTDHQTFNDEEVAFLFDSLDEDFYDDEESDDEYVLTQVDDV